MNKIKNLHEVSRIYFFALVLAYVAMVLSFRNDLWAEFFLNLMRILDIPLAFVSLLYGGTTLALQLNLEKEEGTPSPWVLVIFAGSLLLFALVVVVNFAFPSVI